MEVKERDTLRNYWILYSAMTRMTQGKLTTTQMRNYLSDLNINTRDFADIDSAVSNLVDILPSDYDDSKNSFKDQNVRNEYFTKQRKIFDNYANKDNYTITAIDPRFESLFDNLKDVPNGILMAYSDDTHSLRELNNADNVVSQQNEHDEANLNNNSVLVMNDAINTSSIENLSDKEVESAGIVSPFYSSNAQMALNRGLDIDEVNSIRQGISNDLANNSGIINNADYNLANSNAVQNLMDQFFSSDDMKKMNSVIDRDHGYPWGVLNASQELLEYVYDHGYTFSVKTGTQPNQVDISLNDSNNTQVRILDDDQKMVGRCYTGDGTYYYIGKGDSDWVPKHSYSALDFVLGNSSDDNVINYAKGTPNVNIGLASEDLPGTPVKLHYKKNSSLDTMLASMSEENSGTELKELVEHSRENYIDALIDDNSDIDPQLTQDISELQQWVDDNGLADFIHNDLHDNKIKLKQYLHGDKSVIADDDRLNDERNLDLLDKYSEKIDSLVDNSIGTYDDGFNPSKVANYNQDHNSNKVTDYIVGLMKKSQYDTDKIKGTDFGSVMFQDRLVQFDKDSSVELSDVDDPFKKNVLQKVQDDLVNAHVYGNMKDGYDYIDKHSVPKVFMDDKGVIKWQGIKQYGANRNAFYQNVSGEIGQIFTPDDKGVLNTEFGSGKDYSLVPGNRAYFMHKGLDQGVSRMERLRGQSYPQLVDMKIDSAIRQQVMRNGVDLPVGKDGFVDLSSSTDATMMNGLYHGDLYGKRIEKDWFDNPNLSDEFKTAKIHSLLKRTRFDNTFGENATTFAIDEQYPNAISKLADRKNMRTLDKDYINTFDMEMTGTNKNQGIILYISQHAKLNPDGTFKKAPEVLDKDGNVIPDKADIRNLDEFKYAKYNAWDRNLMAANQALTALGVDHNVKGALMTMGGWTFDDSCVISKAMAERNMVPDVNGNMRPLTVGDKLSDFGGNKSTIGLIVDPDMDPELAEKKGISKEVAIFKKNGLDYVGSPYSVLTRDNTGVVHELMDSKVEPVIDPDTGEVIGESGNLNVTMTDMTADMKTHAYTKEDVLNGGGRKLSSQGDWALDELDARGVLREKFAKSDKKWSDLREYFVSTGLDLAPDGTMQLGYHPQKDEARKTFDISPAVSGSDFLNQISGVGGMLNLPCKIKMKSGVETDQLPILSSKLRRNKELLDGEMKINDYTQDYIKVYDNAATYLEHKNDPKMSNKLIRDQFKLQNSVDTLQSKISDAYLGGDYGHFNKHSYFRNDIMGERLQNSATSVWTADPTLDMDQIKVSPQVKKSLGDPRNNSYVAVERDPILRASAIRGMRVQVDPELTGVAVNPAMATIMDGDFDGDTVGLFTVKSKDAKNDLRTKMSFKNNLLDPLTNKSAFNTSMDVTAGALKAGIVKLDKDDPTNTPKKQLTNLYTEIANKYPKDALKKISAINREAIHNNNFGADNVMLNSDDAMYKSLKKMVDTGAKGNEKSLSEYKMYFDGNKTIDVDNDVQFAQGVKSDMTGVAGANSQRNVLVSRNTNIAPSLETSYLFTQGALQAKHHRQQAVNIYEALTKDIPSLYKGHPIGAEDPKQPLTKTNFVNSMTDVIQNKLGADVNPNFVQSMADSLSDGGQIIKPIKEMGDKNGSPLDIAAYGHGFSSLVNLAKNNANLTDGKYTSQFAPDSMLEARKQVEAQVSKDDPDLNKALDNARQNVDTHLLKKDTQVESVQEMLDRSSKSIDVIASDDLKKKLSSNTKRSLSRKSNDDEIAL